MTHPLTELVPEMIAKVGIDEALSWWLSYAMECPAAHHDCKDAIDALVKGDEDRMIIDENGEDVCRAFQLAAIFQLQPFVEATR